MKKIYISLIISALFMVGFCIGANAMTDEELSSADYVWINGVQCFNYDHLNETYMGTDNVLPSNFIHMTLGSSIDYLGNSVTVTNVVTSSDGNSATYTISYVDYNGNAASLNKTVDIKNGGQCYMGYLYRYTSSGQLYIYLGYTDKVTYFGDISNTGTQITDPDYSEPAATMELVNWSDPLTSEAYVHVSLPYSTGYLRLTRRYIDENGDYNTENCGGFGVFGAGEHDVTLDKMNLSLPGTYVLSLYNDSTGDLDAMKVFTLSKGYVPNLCMTLYNVPAKGENISEDFKIIVHNPNLEPGYLEVMDTNSGEVIKTIYLLTFNKLGSGFGSAFDGVNRSELELNFTDLGISKVGSYRFYLCNEAGEWIDVAEVNVSGFNYNNSNINNSENDDLSDYDFTGIFEYPELSESANVIDYIKWICACILITVKSIVQVVQNFILSCASFSSMIASFFNFLPMEFRVMIPIAFAIIILGRVLGR